MKDLLERIQNIPTKSVHDCGEEFEDGHLQGQNNMLDAVVALIEVDLDGRDAMLCADETHEAFLAEQPEPIDLSEAKWDART